MQRFLIIIAILGFGFWPRFSAQAESFHLEGDQLTFGSDIVSSQGDFKLTLPPGQYSYVDLYVFAKAADNLPEGIRLISQIFDYYILSPEVSDSFSGGISLTYDSLTSPAKIIYYYDFVKKSWQPLISSVNPDQSTISANITGRKGLVGVFELADLESDASQVNFYSQFYLNYAGSTDDKIITKLTSYNNLNYPETKVRTSNIFQFDIINKDQVKLGKPLEISIADNFADHLNRAIYYWDNNRHDWVKLPSWVNYYDNTVSANIHLPYARVAVFIEPDQQVGEASWYAWKNGNFCASRDYPKGAKLKVTNITKTSKNFGKNVLVTVNDFGPEVWTGRIIDLDKFAYKQIGYLQGGVMAVAVELVK